MKSRPFGTGLKAATVDRPAPLRQPARPRCDRDARPRARARQGRADLDPGALRPGPRLLPAALDGSRRRSGGADGADHRLVLAPPLHRSQELAPAPLGDLRDLRPRDTARPLAGTDTASPGRLRSTPARSARSSQQPPGGARPSVQARCPRPAPRAAVQAHHDPRERHRHEHLQHRDRPIAVQRLRLLRRAGADASSSSTATASRTCGRRRERRPGASSRPPPACPMGAIAVYDAETREQAA